MKKIVSIISVIALVVPVLIVFHSFFKSGPLAFGDAPFFYSQGLSELIAEPMAWTNRGINLGGINLLVFISPLTILYGFLGSILKLGNDFAIRAIFYFPSIIFSVVGIFFLSRYLKLSRTVTFFTTFVYILNTYFLLVVDGGQVGVALAYGFFPLSILFLKKAFDKPNLAGYLLSLVFLILCSVADPRVGMISILTIFIWQVVELCLKRDFKGFKNFRILLILIISWIGLSSYWIVPLIKNQPPENIFEVMTSSTNKLFNAFLMFSPHWPENIFGQTSSPSFYFLFIPVIIFIPVIASIFRKNVKHQELLSLVICYIIFCLLTVSAQYISKLPFGFAFRDTSKFFIPVALFTGLLIGKSVEYVDKKLFSILVYIYLLILVAPALFGKMNFVLSDRRQNNDLQKIYQNLSNDHNFYRTLWIPERHPLSYDSKNNPALDGHSLVNIEPFAFNNTGGDPFNFLNSGKTVDWFRILGIKYVVMSDDQRKLDKTTLEVNNWQNINTLISESKGFEKQDWGTNISVFKISNSMPRIFSVNKVFGVVGKPINDPNIPTLNYEDGIFDPTIMKEVSKNGYSIVLNGGNLADLQMSMLQKYFISPSKSTKSEWAVYGPNDYLKYKYELLIRDVKFEDLDYSKGIAFSTKPGEKLEFDFNVSAPGNYVVGVRSMIPEFGQNSLAWQFENLNLKEGTYKKVIENKSNLEIVNVVALVPKKEFDDSLTLSNDLIKNFGVDISKIKKEKLEYKNVEVENSGTLRYKIINPGDNYWIIFSDSFNSSWNLRTGDLYYKSYPAYSMINAFYIEPKWGDLEIIFKGQENVRWGIYGTIISGLIITIMSLILIDKKWKKLN